MKPGDTIDNVTLRSTFAVGNMGGMRRSLQKNVLVIVSDYTKGLYEDHWENDVLHYTGMGASGPQDLAYAQNKTLSESSSNGVRVHLFEVFEQGRYVYVGEVELADKPYQEDQVGADDKPRLVWMFPVRLKAGAEQPEPTANVIQGLQRIKELALLGRAESDLKRLAMGAQPKPGKRKAAVEQYSRNPYVSAYVKKSAKGRCDLCENEAPFESKGVPYFHCHHVLWLSRNGPDIIQNSVALCPNCHARMHELDLRDDKVKLIKRMAVRDPDLEPFDVPL